MNTLLSFHSKDSPAAAVRCIRLGKHATHSLALGDEEIALVRIAEGQGWITLEGDRTDYAARRGEAVRLSGPGLLVIEGLRDENAMEVSTHFARAMVA